MQEVMDKETAPQVGNTVVMGENRGIVKAKGYRRFPDDASKPIMCVQVHWDNGQLTWHRIIDVEGVIWQQS